MNKIITFILLIFLVASCQKPQLPTGGETVEGIENITVSENFNWKTTKDITVVMQLKAELMRSKIILPDGTLVYKGYPSDTNSRTLRTKITIPTYVDNIVVSNGMTQADVSVSDNVFVDFNNLPDLKSTQSDCGECDGQVTKLKLKYIGTETNPNVEVTQKNSGSWVTIYNGPSSPDFEFIGINNNNKMGARIRLYVDGIFSTEIHTSCSQTMLAAMIFGDFEVVSGESRNGGELCTIYEAGIEYSGALLFEDLYPSKGDYDFNDLVINYEFLAFKTDQNILDSLVGTFVIEAFGASFQNGFGFQLPNIANNKIEKVTGYVLKNNTIFNMRVKGTENNQSISTFIVYDDSYDLMTHPGSGTGVNTTPWAPYVTPDTVVLKIEFKSNVSYDDLDIGNFNPFLVVDQVRGTEVHLVNNEPSSLFNTSLFTSFEDDSDPTLDRYYLTVNNLPWAINVPDRNFTWTNEKVDISYGYLKFIEWAESEGVEYDDWYKDKTGYRDDTKLYVK